MFLLRFFWKFPLNSLGRTVSYLLLATSLLAVFRAPAYPLWFVAIVATEAGTWLSALCLLMLRRQTWWLSLAALLFLSPLLRAIPVAKNLPGGLVEAFGNLPPRASLTAPARSEPFALKNFFRLPASPGVQKMTLAFGQRGPQTLLMDVYRGAGTDQRPAVLIVHGGGWEGGSREELPALNDYLAARGYLVIAPDYRLAPQHVFPAPMQDIAQAIRYIETNAKDLGYNDQQMVLLGRSAGGQIALLAAETTADPQIKGAIGFYSPSDMVFAFSRGSNPLILSSRRLLKNYLGSADIADFQKASPLLHVTDHTPPILLIHGGRDEIVWPVHSARLTERMKAAGRPVFYLFLPWATHGADAVFTGPSGQLTTFAVERFLANVMPREPLHD